MEDYGNTLGVLGAIRRFEIWQDEVDVVDTWGAFSG